MPKCYFSGEEIKQGTGIMLVKKNGDIRYYKNNKSLKNGEKLKRQARNTKWTVQYHDAKKLTQQAKTKGK